MKRQVTENLEVDLDRLEWCCHHCGSSLGPARENYKKGCLIAERSPHEIWRPLVDEKHSFSYDPGWTRLVEFYCPGCAVMMDVEMLPPGHPITHDIELDLDELVRRERKDQAR
jgi:acetophenone carboxylase